MAKQFKRADRVASELQKQLSLILQREINTTNLGMVSVNNLEISPDLVYAKAYITFLDIGESSALTPEQKIKELNKSIPYIRSLLGKAVKLRIVPELKFIYDNSAETLDHMNRVIKQALSR